MGFFRQEYWSGLPFPSPGDLPTPGIEPVSPVSSAFRILYHWTTWEAQAFLAVVKKNLSAKLYFLLYFLLSLLLTKTPVFCRIISRAAVCVQCISTSWHTSTNLPKILSLYRHIIWILKTDNLRHFATTKQALPTSIPSWGGSPHLPSTSRPISSSHILTCWPELQTLSVLPLFGGLNGKYLQ